MIYKKGFTKEENHTKTDTDSTYIHIIVCVVVSNLLRSVQWSGIDLLQLFLGELQLLLNGTSTFNRTGGKCLNP